jgi:hypothetical protein
MKISSSKDEKNITIVVGGAVDLLQPTRQETLRQPKQNEQVGQENKRSRTMHSRRYEHPYPVKR